MNCPVCLKEMLKGNVIDLRAHKSIKGLYCFKNKDRHETQFWNNGYTIRIFTGTDNGAWIYNEFENYVENNIWTAYWKEIVDYEVDEEHTDIYQQIVYVPFNEAMTFIDRLKKMKAFL